MLHYLIMHTRLNTVMIFETQLRQKALCKEHINFEAKLTLGGKEASSSNKSVLSDGRRYYFRKYQNF